MEKNRIIPTVYPAETVKKISELGFSEYDYLNKNRGDFSYEGNSGHKEPTLVKSPHYALTIEETEVPVYATIVYIGAKLDCALHSFAIVEYNESFENGMDIKLTSLCSAPKKMLVLPKKNALPLKIIDENIFTRIDKPGDFTFVVCDENSDVDQYNSFTLFTRYYVNQDKEISDYIDEYGEEKVTIFDEGIHYIDHLTFERDDSVLYLKRGSLIIAKGNPLYTDKKSYAEEGAKDSTGFGFTRYPLISAYKRKNIRIAGRGALDAGQLGWHERRGIVFSHCSDFEISGINLMNIPEWAIIIYCSSDFAIRDVQIFGYKTNSDGIAACNSVEGIVSNCFARSGDDLFEVKTFRGDSEASVAKNILFRNCIAWAGKARCFGVIAELYRDVSNVTFKDCSVIIRDATWDNEILGSLVVICSEGDGKISDILFEDIDIFCDFGRAINIINTDIEQMNRAVKNIVFRNIKYSSKLPDTLIAGDGNKNEIKAKYVNVVSNGKLISKKNFGTDIIIDKNIRLQISDR